MHCPLATMVALNHQSLLTQSQRPFARPDSPAPLLEVACTHWYHAWRLDIPGLQQLSSAGAPSEVPEAPSHSFLAAMLAGL